MQDKIFKALLIISAIIIPVIGVGIVFSLVNDASGAFEHFGFWNFIFSDDTNTFSKFHKAAFAGVSADDEKYKYRIFDSLSSDSTNCVFTKLSRLYTAAHLSLPPNMPR